MAAVPPPGLAPVTWAPEISLRQLQATWPSTVPSSTSAPTAAGSSGPAPNKPCSSSAPLDRARPPPWWCPTCSLLRARPGHLHQARRPTGHPGQPVPARTVLAAGPDRDRPSAARHELDQVVTSKCRPFLGMWSSMYTDREAKAFVEGGGQVPAKLADSHQSVDVGQAATSLGLNGKRAGLLVEGRANIALIDRRVELKFISSSRTRFDKWPRRRSILAVDPKLCWVPGRLRGHKEHGYALESRPWCGATPRRYSLQPDANKGGISAANTEPPAACELAQHSGHKTHALRAVARRDAAGSAPVTPEGTCASASRTIRRVSGTAALSARRARAHSSGLLHRRRPPLDVERGQPRFQGCALCSYHLCRGKHSAWAPARFFGCEPQWSN